MNISLIIITRNRFDVLIKNLKHNLREFASDDEIIIVDSSCEDCSGKFKIEFKAENIHYHRTRAGKNFQRNYGVAHASGDIFLFLDDDIQLIEGSISSLRTFFINHLEFDGVTGPLINKNEPSKAKQFFEKVFSKVFFTPAFGNAGFTRSGLPIIPLETQPYHEAFFLCGGFSAYKRDIFKNISFDEHFKGYAYLEDTDFSLSVVKIGRFVFLPEFKGYHSHLSTLQKDHSETRKELIENFYYVFNKHHIGSRALFYWTAFGFLIINLAKSFTCFNFSYVIGTWHGIINIIKSEINQG
jgi:GT2 family glycosyltransferase